jgi:hypothetical protein
MFTSRLILSRFTWLRARQLSFIDRGAKVNAFSPSAPGFSPETVMGNAGMVGGSRAGLLHSAAARPEDLAVPPPRYRHGGEVLYVAYAQQVVFSTAQQQP